MCRCIVHSLSSRPSTTNADAYFCNNAFLRDLVGLKSKVECSVRMNHNHGNEGRERALTSAAAHYGYDYDYTHLMC